jgi:peptidoglycan/xylan/chitin deacetylase (PgdA/CDA1 family)
MTEHSQPEPVAVSHKAAYSSDMLHNIKTMLRDTPLLREATLWAGSTVKSMAKAPGGLYTLCYHHVAPGLERNFAAQIRFLKRHGEFLDAERAASLVAMAAAGDKPRFLLSLDDGYADNRDIALPVLAEQGVPAILFLVSDWLDHPPGQFARREGYMTRDDVRAWLRAGMSIGSHSATHRRFSQLSRDEVNKELARSRDELSDLAGRPVRDFACPWGVADKDFDAVRDPGAAASCGYRTFFTTRRGRANHPADLLAMPRHVLEPHWGTYQLQALLGGWKGVAP